MISAAIQYGGDVLGDNIGAAITAGVGFTVSVGSLGGAIDAFLRGIYRDSILAHMSVPLLARVSKQGWGHYLETASTTVTQAYTAASIADLRARRRETDPDTAFTLQVANASPWLIGDNGHGHWWHGDRVGGTSKYLMPRVFVRRNRKLDITWDAKGIAIAAEFGDTRSEKDGFDRIVALVSKAMGGLQQIGLWIVLFLLMTIGVVQAASYDRPGQQPEALASSHYADHVVLESVSDAPYWRGSTPGNTTCPCMNGRYAPHSMAGCTCSQE